MFWLAALCCSVFVPPAATSETRLREFDEDSFRKWSSPTDTVIALIVSDYGPLVEEFATIGTLFAGRSQFCFFRARNCPHLLRAVQVRPPALLFFFRGKLALAAKLDDSKSGLLSQISEWLTPPKEIARTKEELYAKLGGADRTLVVKGDAGARGTMMVSSILPYSGPCAVVKATDEVFKELGISDSPLAMFRKYDKTILPVSENFLEMYQATLPFVSKVTPAEMQLSNLFAVMVDEKLDEQKHGALYRLGEKHFEFCRFGVLEKDSFAILQQLNITTTIPNFVVFSVTGGYFYPNDGLVGKSFTDDDWYDVAESYIKKIIDEKIERQYLSEEPEKNTGAFEKVVGKNYREFVSDVEHDVVMIYHQNRTQDNMTMMEFEKVASEIIANGTTSLKFGSIDTTVNSCDMRFPFMISVPMVHIFPAKNKSNSRPMFSMPNRNSFLRFVKKYASIPVSWEAPEISFEEAAMEQMTLGMKLNAARLPSPLHEYAIEHMEQLEMIINETKIRLDGPTDL